MRNVIFKIFTHIFLTNFTTTKIILNHKKNVANVVQQ